MVAESKSNTAIYEAASRKNIKLQGKKDVDKWQAHIISILGRNSHEYFLLPEFAMQIDEEKVTKEKIQRLVNKRIALIRRKGRGEREARNSIDDDELSGVEEEKGKRPMFSKHASPMHTSQAYQDRVTSAFSGRNRRVPRRWGEDGSSLRPLPTSTRRRYETPARAGGNPSPPESVMTPARASSKKDIDRERRMVERANRLVERMNSRPTTCETRTQVRQGVFLDPLSAEEPGSEDGPSTAIHPFVYEGELMLFEVEDVEQAELRGTIDDWIRGTVNLEPHYLAGLALGDIHGIYTRVMEQFDHADRATLAKKVREDLRELRKKPEETFATFVSKANDIFLRMKSHNLKIDREIVLGEVSEAITESNCEMSKICYDEFVDRLTQDDEDALTATGLLEAMKKPMLRKEQRRMASPRKTRVNATSQHRQAMVQADEDLWGVCLRYQRDACTKTDCGFKHIKLDKDQVEALTKKVGAAVKCHACGGRGHRKADCPKPPAVKVNAASTQAADTAQELIKRLRTRSVTDAEKAELRNLLK